jgi:hypothetical protein
MIINHPICRGAETGRSQKTIHAAAPSPDPLPLARGRAIANSSATAGVNRVAACPQGSDCAGDGTPAQVFDCEQGCAFRGCAACMKAHEDEPHVSDSDHMLAMIRDIGGKW